MSLGVSYFCKSDKRITDDLLINQLKLEFSKLNMKSSSITSTKCKKHDNEFVGNTHILEINSFALIKLWCALFVSVGSPTTKILDGRIHRPILNLLRFHIMKHNKYDTFDVNLKPKPSFSLNHSLRERKGAILNQEYKFSLS